MSADPTPPPTIDLARYEAQDQPFVTSMRALAEIQAVPGITPWLTNPRLSRLSRIARLALAKEWRSCFQTDGGYLVGLQSINPTFLERTRAETILSVQSNLSTSQRGTLIMAMFGSGATNPRTTMTTLQHARMTELRLRGGFL